ncbi:MAG: hypothetical protein ACYC6Y_24690 [Thermoguttaceae bacterium]
MMQCEHAAVRSGRKRGAALLVALVCVSIAVAVMYGLVQLAVQGYREAGLEERRAQAAWIAESSADLAAARLKADREYRGETWHLSAEALGRRQAAEVRIEVKPLEAEPGWRRVRIVADYPLELPDRARATREFRIRVNP